MKVTAESLMRVLLDLDQQCVTSRPSPWGDAAVLVSRLCCAAEGQIGQPGKDLGDWRSVDLSGVDRPAPRELDQPDLGRFTGRAEIERLTRERDALRQWKATEQQAAIEIAIALVSAQIPKGIRGNVEGVCWLAAELDKARRDRDALIAAWPTGLSDHWEDESRGAAGLTNDGRWVVMHDDRHGTFDTKEAAVRAAAGLDAAKEGE